MAESKIMRLYAKMPIWAQNYLFDIQGRRILKQRYNANFHKLLDWLNESQWWTIDKLREHQNVHLRKLIKHAYETVPYYNRVMKERNLFPEDIQSAEDLCKLPLLTKEIVLAEGKNMYSRACTEKMVYSSTSGSTGSYMKVPMTSHCRDLQWAVWWRHRTRFGFNLGDYFLCISGKPVVPYNQAKPPFWRVSKSLNQVYASVFHMKDEYLKYYVEYLEKEKFQFLVGYPSSFYLIGDYLRKTGHRLASSPKYIITGSESVLDVHHHICEEWLGAKIADQYGQAECCANCAQCSEAMNYHVDMEMCIVEKLPANNVNFANAGWIVGTSLYNYHLPFIRYNTMDIGEFSDQPCACGRHSDVIKRIDGRVESFIITADGRRIGRLYHCFTGAKGVKQAQIVQESLDYLVLRIVPGAGYTQESAEILKNNFKAKIGRNIKIDVETVDKIETSKSGKFRAVISKLDKTFIQWQE